MGERGPAVGRWIRAAATGVILALIFVWVGALMAPRHVTVILCERACEHQSGQVPLWLTGGRR